ncbi:MAG: phospho-N-acetylmuramoyl-pentapeptide-transferase [Deltaproteobacteria bacterium]|nr:phospho-N-acetylmuramoyl-pentapeptide-transferase [Deltaproteobacteria bacterium]
MLYHVIYPFFEYFKALNVLRYITFRTFLAVFIGMTVYFIFGKPMIAFIHRKQYWQTVRDDGPVTHMDKRGTPTMGGILLWIAVTVAMLFCGRFDQPYVIGGLTLMVLFALIGFIDDYRKVILRDAKGLRARWKFPFQVLVATAIAFFLFDGMQLPTVLHVPFMKTFQCDLGGFAIPFAVLVIVGASNAVNLTDGLDGLVSMPSIIAFLAYGIFSYVAGHAMIANYLQLPWISGSGELTVLCGAVVGATIGFLWYNAHPASIFMGDVGSLPMGALLGYVAVVTKNEILLLIVGGIFVLETISVMTQVISFKLTGKRVFRMAPIHHHFELKGWAESKVIARFWIISMILALLGLATLKLR